MRLVTRPDLARYETLLAETDRFDSAQLTLEDVVAPSGYILVGLTLDPRTGLGGARQYFDLLLRVVRERPMEEVAALPEVRSIFNRTSRANLGVLMSLYGGGGHAGAGACALPPATADARIADVVSTLKRNG